MGQEWERDGEKVRKKEGEGEREGEGEKEGEIERGLISSILTNALCEKFQEKITDVNKISRGLNFFRLSVSLSSVK